MSIEPGIVFALACIVSAIGAFRAAHRSVDLARHQDVTAVGAQCEAVERDAGD